MQDISLPLRMTTLPGIVLRGQHALILVRDKAGKFVLGQKKIYPPTISRLIGGGIDKGENPQTGAAREVQEELGIPLQPDQLEPLAKITAQITHPDKKVTFVTWLYFLQLNGQAITPSSDLDGVSYLTETELRALIKRYQKLPTEIDQEKGFAWSDYGQLYSRIHQIALDEYLQLAETRTLTKP